MDDRRNFLLGLARTSPTRTEQAGALLWFYEQTQQFTERTVGDLVKDIEENGFGKQKTSRLKQQLVKSKFTVRGSRKDTFRINAAYFQELTEKHGSLVNVVRGEISSSVIPLEFVSGTKTYLERMVKQINGCYDSGFFDASLVILRRLTESLIIEVYQKEDRIPEIRGDNTFFQLNKLISKITSDPAVLKGRGFSGGLELIKDLGDTAAHNRTYITPREDIDDNKTKIRKTIYELLVLSGIKS